LYNVVGSIRTVQWFEYVILCTNHKSDGNPSWPIRIASFIPKFGSSLTVRETWKVVICMPVLYLNMELNSDSIEQNIEVCNVCEMWKKNVV
jgi:hypothetical protein